MSNSSSPEDGWRPNFEDMKDASDALGIVMCVYLSINFAFVLFDISVVLFMKQSWLDQRRTADSVKWRKILAMRGLVFAVAVFNTLTFMSTALSAFIIPFELGVEACTWIIRGYSLGYTLSLQMVFVFFIIRSSFVEGLQTTRTFNMVSKVTKFGLIFFLPLFVVPYVFFILQGKVTSDRICTVMNINLWFIISLIIGIAALTAVTIYLFYTPLKRSIAAAPPEKTAGIKRVMYRNLAFNILAMTGSVVCLSLFAYLNHTLESGAESIRGVIFSTTDLFILGICARGMMIEEKHMMYVYNMCRRKRGRRQSKRRMEHRKRCCCFWVCDDTTSNAVSEAESGPARTVREDDTIAPLVRNEPQSNLRTNINQRTTLEVRSSDLLLSVT